MSDGVPRRAGHRHHNHRVVAASTVAATQAVSGRTGRVASSAEDRHCAAGDCLCDLLCDPGPRRRSGRRRSGRRRSGRPGHPRDQRAPARIHLHRQGRRAPGRRVRGRRHAQLPRLLHRHARGRRRLVAAPGERRRAGRGHRVRGRGHARPPRAPPPPARRRRRHRDRRALRPRERLPRAVGRCPVGRVRRGAARRHAFPVEGRAARLRDALERRRAADVPAGQADRGARPGAPGLAGHRRARRRPLRARRPQRRDALRQGRRAPRHGEGLPALPGGDRRPHPAAGAERAASRPSSPPTSSAEAAQARALRLRGEAFDLLAARRARLEHLIARHARVHRRRRATTRRWPGRASRWTT